MKRFLSVLAVTAALPAAVSAQQFGGHFMESWDTDSDGTVTLAEVEIRRGDIFYMFDSNEDGFLDAQEYVQFDETRVADREVHMEEAQETASRGASMGQGKGQGTGMSAGISGVQNAMTLAYNDTDGDGQVSREEFTSNTAGWFVTMDKTGDGVVNADDFGRK
ncbi:EF-hand domain-containing protein [Celeribacter marinus]|uniref:EF-hand domain-containing protein n=1 Tax=Celeribacter marinus TaxID=1397108 RepID=UPI003F6B7F9D